MQIPPPLRSGYLGLVSSTKAIRTDAGRVFDVEKGGKVGAWIERCGFVELLFATGRCFGEAASNTGAPPLKRIVLQLSILTGSKCSGSSPRREPEGLAWWVQ
jgi:hypothetical protein